MIQRGNRRQLTFFAPDDYRAYREIAAEAFAEAKVEVWAYCLMPNHVHLIATPADETGLTKAIGATHQRYTWRINQKQGWTGCLWQSRFGFFPMDEEYLRLCARYVGLNPVRAGLVRRAADWPWSSVTAHLSRYPDRLLSPEPLATRLGDAMTGFFDVDVSDDCRRTFHQALETGRPLARLNGRTAGDTPLRRVP
ncbi:MAG TPA: transposase [Caulobacter sp.]|nr:transposase [Caulobacter sp.]